MGRIELWSPLAIGECMARLRAHADTRRNPFLRSIAPKGDCWVAGRFRNCRTILWLERPYIANAYRAVLDVRLSDSSTGSGTSLSGRIRINRLAAPLGLAFLAPLFVAAGQIFTRVRSSRMTWEPVDISVALVILVFVGAFSGMMFITFRIARSDSARLMEFLSETLRVGESEKT
jgi:hypothetical protein